MNEIMEPTNLALSLCARHGRQCTLHDKCWPSFYISAVGPAPSIATEPVTSGFDWTIAIDQPSSEWCNQFSLTKLIRRSLLIYLISELIAAQPQTESGESISEGTVHDSIDELSFAEMAVCLKDQRMVIRRRERAANAVDGEEEHLFHSFTNCSYTLAAFSQSSASHAQSTSCYNSSALFLFYYFMFLPTHIDIPFIIIFYSHKCIERSGDFANGENRRASVCARERSEDEKIL